MATGHEFEVKKYKEYELIESVIKDINVKYNSVRLVGSNSPNEKRNLILQNGTIIPIGEIIDLNK